MAAIIRIKRSTGVAAPGTLKTGELAYSYGTGAYNNLGDRLFFGKGDDGSGNATSVVVIGGEYFGNMLDHAPGTVTANSAIIVDSASKIDIIKVDDIQINGNSISTTVTNRDLVLDPNGTGSINVNISKIINVVDPANAQDAATKNYVDTQNAAQTFSFVTDAGSGSINLTDSSLTFAGGVGLSTAYAGNTITINLDNTTVTAGSYGSATQIPVLDIDSQGRVTNATVASIATTLNIAGETGTGSVSLLDSSLSITGTNGIKTTASGTAFNVSIDSNASVIVGSLDVQNNLIVEGNLQVNGTTVTVNSTTLEVTDNMIYMNAGESSGSPTQFVDVGWAANVNDTGSYQHVGIFRDATDGVFKIFQGYTPEPDSDVQLDVTHPSFAFAPLRVSSITGIYVGFDSDFGVKTTTDLSEGTNLYYTTARADSDFDVRLATKTTSDLTEGSNLYFTNERVDDRLNNLLLAGEGVDLAYDDSANTLTISTELATVTNPGVASFDSDQFTVTSGFVTISVIDGGTY